MAAWVTDSLSLSLSDISVYPCQLSVTHTSPGAETIETQSRASEFPAEVGKLALEVAFLYVGSRTVDRSFAHNSVALHTCGKGTEQVARFWIS
jgi:hypothetical protein